MMEAFTSWRFCLLFFIICCGPDTPAALLRGTYDMKMLKELKTISSELSTLNGEVRNIEANMKIKATGNELKTTYRVKQNKEALPLSERCTNHEGYSYLPDSGICVRYAKHPKATWKKARDICAVDGGDLVKLDTKLKSETIYIYLMNAHKVNFGSFAMFSSKPWIGLQTSKNKSTWVDDSPMKFSRLNNVKSTSSTLKCVQIGQGIFKLWFEESCDSEANVSICEIV